MLGAGSEKMLIWRTYMHRYSDGRTDNELLVLYNKDFQRHVSYSWGEDVGDQCSDVIVFIECFGHIQCSVGFKHEKAPLFGWTL